MVQHKTLWKTGVVPTTTAPEDATEDTTDKDGPYERVEKSDTYSEQVSASVRIAEASRAGVSMQRQSAQVSGWPSEKNHNVVVQ